MEGGLSYSTLLNVTFLLWFMRYYAQILTFAIFFIKNLPNDCSIAVSIGATSRPYSIEILIFCYRPVLGPMSPLHDTLDWGLLTCVRTPR